LLIRQFVSSHAPSSERGLDLSPTLVPKSKGALQRFFRQSLDRHAALSYLDLTMNVYTDPSLLDVAGALEALPELGLDHDQQTERDAGTARP